MRNFSGGFCIRVNNGIVRTAARGAIRMALFLIVNSFGCLVAGKGFERQSHFIYLLYIKIKQKKNLRMNEFFSNTNGGGEG